MFTDYLKFAVKSIKHRKLRSWLTMVGIFIGIAAVVSLISLGQGLQDTINEQFQKVGGNRIIITPGGGITGVGAMAASDYSSAKLTDHDVGVVKRVRGVENARGMWTKSMKVEFKGEYKYVMVFGVPTDAESQDLFKKIDYFVVDEGRYLSNGDRYNAIIGVKFTKDLFKEKIKRGDRIYVEEQEFEVVGINKRAGNPIHDSKLTIPIDVARELSQTKEKEVSRIAVETEDSFKPSDVAEDIKKALRRDHGLKEGEEDFTVQTMEQLVRSFSAVLNIVRVVLTGIAAISLIVGGVGIMNTTYTSVLERTREIGVMKSVGAQNSDILLIFLIESGILGLVGGVIGCILGVGFSKTVEFAAAKYFDSLPLKAYLSWDLILGVMAFSFIIGCISGAMPARQASRLRPVDALRFR